jgi:hypothetical protein
MNVEDIKTNSPRRIKNVKEIISESKIPFEQTDGKLSIPVDVLPNQVKVFLIE